jgi:hypothetical protein
MRGPFLAAAALGAAVALAPKVALASGPIWGVLAEIPDPADGGTLFGASVALNGSGSALLVTSPDEVNGGGPRGGLYAITRSGDGGTWQPTQHVPAPPMSSGYAEALAVDGDTVAVLDANGVHVLTRAGSAYSETQFLESLAGISIGLTYPGSLALHANLLVFVNDYDGPAPLNVYTRSDAASPFELVSGFSATVEPYGLAIGDDRTIFIAETGSLYAYSPTNAPADGGPSWAPAGAIPIAAGGRFTGVMAVGGGYLVAGAALTDDAGATSYAAEIYRGAGASWQLASSLPLPGPGGSWSPSSIAIGEGSAIIGMAGADQGALLPSSGAALIAPLDGGLPSNLFPPDLAAVDEFGSGVALPTTGAVAFAGAARKVGRSGAKGAVYVFELALPLGTTCAAPGDCLSGFCVDGVCCDSACGGGLSDDCVACSHSSSPGGTCGPADMGTQCQAATECSVAATCDGVSTFCPATANLPNGTHCAAGECVDGKCNTLVMKTPPPSPFEAGPGIADAGPMPSDDAAATSGGCREGDGGPTDALSVLSALAAALALAIARRLGRERAR